MNKLRPRNKICFQNKNNPHTNLKISKLKKKKWNYLKKQFRFFSEIKPEKRKRFFQRRLFEKQQFKNFYGCLSEYKFKNLYKNLLKKNNKINFFHKFVVIIETRLDINLLRLKFVKSIFQAQQFINHKKIKVNNQIINKPGFLLKKGDIINING
jgi:ribosomal protein S4